MSLVEQPITLSPSHHRALRHAAIRKALRARLDRAYGNVETLKDSAFDSLVDAVARGFWRAARV